MNRLALSSSAFACVAIIATQGCQPRHRGADWVVGAPQGTVIALSGQAGWMIQRPEFQGALHEFPLAEQALDLFLKRAHIDPASETGRLTFYAMDLYAKSSIQGSNFLLQLSHFKDPKNLMVAVTEAFPMEGSLQTTKGELPLHVLFDYNTIHVRMAFDTEGNVWIGDLAALGRLNQPRAASPATVRASQWIDAQAPFQGLLLTEDLMKNLSADLDKHSLREISKDLPKGIEALAWSVAPAASKEAPHQFSLALAGTPEGISQVSPWMHRLVAMIGALPGGSSRPADLLEERTRAGLKVQLTQAQLELVMSRFLQQSLQRDPQAPVTKL